MPVSVSVLFDHSGTSEATLRHDEPPFFDDLNLGQVVDAVVAGYDDYDLGPFYYTALPATDSVTYRHEVFRDLEDGQLLDDLVSFAERMRAMRDHLAQGDAIRYTLQKQRWLVEAAAAYCAALSALADGLARGHLASRALSQFRDYLSRYVDSDAFQSLCAETARLLDELSQLAYCLQIHGNRIVVTQYDSEPDYSADVLDTFAKFEQSGGKQYKVRFPNPPEMNHIEAAVLDRVARLYPDVFSLLAIYCRDHSNYQDETITAFDREIHFYIAYLGYIEPMRHAGLEFSYPDVARETKALFASRTFDLALANKLVHEKSPVVSNDFYMRGAERIFVVSGPNQGGKTTFARYFGQLHYLAKLGCLVPGERTQLFLSDDIYTHFEKEENIANLSGKLQDDLVRVHEILERATPDSIVILNEIFTSTTLHDALFLSTQILRTIIGLGCLCVCVSFIDELSCLADSTVSMVSTVMPEDPAERTYKVVRKPADGLAYATAIADKYGLSYARLKERLAS